MDRHPKAIRWDLKYSKLIDDEKYWAETVEGLVVPRNRPCEYCGERVYTGYIHEDCCNEETEIFYVYTLYG